MAFAQLLPACWLDASDRPLPLLYPELDLYPQAEYDAFAQLLEEVGVTYTYLGVPGAGHSNWNQQDPASWLSDQFTRPGVLFPRAA